MAPISLDQLVQLVEKQDQRLASLQTQINNLKAWSDLSDSYLQEMIDANTASMDHLFSVISEMHEAEAINRKLEKLKAEEQMPISQLLQEFIEENASAEEKEELYHPTICNH